VGGHTKAVTVSQRQRHLVLHIDDVEPFLQPGQDVYLSQHLLGRENCGLHDCFLNCGRLAARRALGGGNHPDNDEVYYVVSGHSWLDLGGDPNTGKGCASYAVEAGSVAFIPAGTFHRLRNEADEDVVILTIWPQAPAPGANGVHDERLAAWGTGFRLRPGLSLVEANGGAHVAPDPTAAHA
jgi:mannose-6-phosphate isomerase-like protein (cupin superfamily)